MFIFPLKSVFAWADFRTVLSTSFGKTFSLVNYLIFICLRTFCNFFSIKFYLLTFLKTIIKSSENLNKGNLLKTCLQSTYPVKFSIISSHSYMAKMKIFEVFKTDIQMEVFVQR